MEFNSLFFICVLLPLFIGIYYGLYYLTRKNLKVLNVLLLLLSILFYSFNGLESLIKILVFVLINYLLCLLINKTKNKLVLAINIIFDVGFLFYIKYLDFVKEVISSNSIMEILRIKNSSIGLVALSFVVFSSIAYCVDIYRKEKDRINIIEYFLFILLFIKLIEGPIMAKDEIESQFKERLINSDKLADGLNLFSLGLARKVIIADNLAPFVEKIFTDYARYGTLLTWLGVIGFGIQLYFDFSGYSKMAIGLGKVFGFDIAINFDRPYYSTSISEFWRRWHISLGKWFRNYIYIPLGGNRKGKVRTLLNLFIVFLLTGIWHGANLNFLLWGIYFGIIMVIERIRPIKYLKHFYTLFIVFMGWVLFRSVNIINALKIYKTMFIYRSAEYSCLSFKTILILIIGIIFIIFEGKIKEDSKIMKGLSLVFLIISILMIVSGSYVASIYGKF